MFSAATCRARRERLLAELGPRQGPLVLSHPINLAYLAGFWVDSISLGSPMGGLLVIEPNGHTSLFHENRLPGSVNLAQVDERVVVPWYTGQAPGQGPRERAVMAAARERLGSTFDVHDRLGHPEGDRIAEILSRHRRRKDAEELALLNRCMRATEAGHAWAREHVRPGMTELAVYSGIAGACHQAADQAVVVYGDFAVSPGPQRRGGAATDRVIQPGEMLILDFSVVILGYRSDFTNTLVVGRPPTAEQQRLYDLCVDAMAAGERQVRAGMPCQQVYDAVEAVFDKAGMAANFGHHAGHGLGLNHPEPPFLVRHSTETLQADDVITLEPGLYVAGVGGIRIENNYQVTNEGFVRLSSHTIRL